MTKTLKEILFPNYSKYNDKTRLVADRTLLKVKEWFEQKNGKLNYLTEKEMDMPKDMVNLQIVLGLQSCKTKNDVCELLEDLRLHERYILLKELSQ